MVLSFRMRPWSRAGSALAAAGGPADGLLAARLGQLGVAERDADDLDEEGEDERHDAPGVVVAVVDELDWVDCALIGGDTLGSPVPPVTLAPRPGVGSSGTQPRPAKYTSGHACASLFLTCHTPSCGVP